MTIEDIARAYHCPHHIAVRLYHRESAAYRCVHRLGPMRVHWRRGDGWMLYNRPIHTDSFADIQKEWEANHAVR